jgi:hypothetical protein
MNPSDLARKDSMMINQKHISTLNKIFTNEIRIY